MKLAALICSAVFLGGSAFARDAGAPSTAISSTADTYFGVTVSDPYRWLENTNDPAVHAWSVAQDTRTRAWFDHVPLRQTIHDRIAKLVAASSPSYHDLTPVAGRLFATVVQPPRQQPFCRRDGAKRQSSDYSRCCRSKRDQSGGHDGDRLVGAFAGRYQDRGVAVAERKRGRDAACLRHRDGARHRGCYPARAISDRWAAARRGAPTAPGFTIRAIPAKSGREADRHFYQQVYFHKPGAAPSTDRYVLGRDFPKLAEIVVSARQNAKYVLVSVANGDGGEFEHFVIPPQGAPRQVTHFADQVAGAAIGPDDRLYLTSRQGAPRGRLLRVDAADPVLAQAATLVPQSDAVIRTEAVGDPVIITPRRHLYPRAGRRPISPGRLRVGWKAPGGRASAACRRGG